MNTFLYGTDPMTHAIEPRLFPYASKMAKRSISKAVPSNILHRANEIWRTKHLNKFFGGSYKSPDPLTYVTQQFGREVCFANGSFGRTAMSFLWNLVHGPNHAPPIPLMTFYHQQPLLQTPSLSVVFARRLPHKLTHPRRLQYAAVGGLNTLLT
jgi:hypothetical protein